MSPKSHTMTFLKRSVFIVFLLSVGAIFAQSKSTSRKEIDGLTKKAQVALDSSKFKESLMYSREALQKSIEINDNYLIATAYNTIAGNMDELSENDKAIFNYQKALSYAGKTTNDSLKGWVNNNLGNIYFFEKKEYKKGLEYYNTAIKFAEKTGDKEKVYLTYVNLGLAYFEVKDYDSGAPILDYLNKNAASSDNDNKAFVQMLNGVYNTHLNKNDQAEIYFTRAIDSANKYKMVTDLSYIYQEYSRFLKKNSRYSEAYNYLEKFDSIKDQIYDQDKLLQANVTGVNIEIDEYKRAIERIEAEKQVQSLSLKKSQIIVILFVIASFILLILLTTLYRNNLFRTKINRDLKVANGALMRAKEAAEEASLLKSRFVSTITHELRTPLYGVVGITNMILDEHQELANSPHLNSLKFSARYLLSLVNDILQINKIEEKRLILETYTFNISDELSVISNSLQFIAAKNGNVLTITADENIPEQLLGDKLRLSQILMNLTSNALKFTKNGSVNVTAKQTKVLDKIHFIEFSVTDTGIGIPKSQQEKVFEKFVQLGRSADDYQGTGLGLSIVKKLIELFGSKITLESEEDKGTKFTFTLSLESDLAKTTEIINNMEVDLTSQKSYNVLVVEDNKINQMVTKKTMEKNNYTCTVVEDGIAALEILKSQEFDAILMDINMPLISGFETTRRIRTAGIKTPVIALTAFDKDEVTEEAIASGMDDIIIKPFDPVKLFRIISAQVSKRQV